MPSRKDKTLVEILDRLKILEGKVDQHFTARPPAPMGFGPPQRSPTSQPSFNTDVDDLTPASTSQRPSQQSSSAGQATTQSYRHASAAHKMLIWPAVQQLLFQSLPPNIGDMKSLEQEGSAFLVMVHRDQPSLPLNDELSSTPFMGMQSQANRTTGGTSVTFPYLTRDVMQRLATSYFDTYNFLYPFMDRQNFLSDTLPRVHSGGFDSDPDSITALLVFALGELAIDGSRGEPIQYHNGRPSGVRGGSTERPPGLALFNEARKRIGFVFTQCNLENVQILSLAAYVTIFRLFDW